MLIKACPKLIHPREIRYASKSNPGKIYTVVTATILNDAFCTCPGWQFRGTCTHIDQAENDHACEWFAGPGEDRPDLCPLCGEPTIDFETKAEFE